MKVTDDVINADVRGIQKFHGRDMDFLAKVFRDDVLCNPFSEIPF